jgi:hypothetical protein
LQISGFTIKLHSQLEAVSPHAARFSVYQKHLGDGQLLMIHRAPDELFGEPTAPGLLAGQTGA